MLLLAHSHLMLDQRGSYLDFGDHHIAKAYARFSSFSLLNSVNHFLLLEKLEQLDFLQLNQLSFSSSLAAAKSV